MSRPRRGKGGGCVTSPVHQAPRRRKAPCARGEFRHARVGIEARVVTPFGAVNIASVGDKKKTKGGRLSVGFHRSVSLQLSLPEHLVTFPTTWYHGRIHLYRRAMGHHPGSRVVDRERERTVQYASVRRVFIPVHGRVFTGILLLLIS